MTVFDLFESIGNVDDELMENMAQPPQHHRKKWLMILSLAACAAFACTGLLIWNAVSQPTTFRQEESSLHSALLSSTIRETSGNASAATEEFQSGESSETAKEMLPFELYYVRDGQLRQMTVYVEADPQTLFVIWKSENNIGSEVQLIHVSIEDNGTTTYSEYSGVATATRTKGDHTTYTLTVSNSLEQYLHEDNRELLLSSLEKTMTGMCDPKPDEYHLILADDPLPDESESNRIDPSEIRYNDQGEILE